MITKTTKGRRPMGKCWGLGAIAALVVVGANPPLAQQDKGTYGLRQAEDGGGFLRLTIPGTIAQGTIGDGLPRGARSAPGEVVAPPPPGALWLALMPLVPIAGGLMTHSYRVLQRRHRVRRRHQRLSSRSRWR